MVLINIDRLSDTELKYIAEQEELDGYASLTRDEIIEALEEIYEDETVSSGLFENAKFIKTLTNTESDVSDLPGVTPLPKSYNTTEIHCILRDSNWAYAFWSISEQEKEKLNEEGQYSLAIRVSLSDSPESTYDIETNSDDSSWTIELPWPGRKYMLTLIAKYADHETKIAKSETITSPQSYFKNNYHELINPDLWDVVVTPVESNGGQTVSSAATDIIRSVREAK